MQSWKQDLAIEVLMAGMSVAVVCGFWGWVALPYALAGGFGSIVIRRLSRRLARYLFSKE